MSEETYKEIAGIISKEKTAWEQGVVTVADAVQYTMREEIDSARKNYFGKFNQPKDPDTGLDKLYVPLIEWTVESVVKNTDKDLKDMRVKSPEGRNKALGSIVKLSLLNVLKRINFSETINDMIRRVTIDGTVVVKITEEYNKEFKRILPKVRIVDTLNLILDRSAYCLQDVPIIEKSVMTIAEISQHKDWQNKDKIRYTQDSVPVTVVLERWGPVRKSWVSGEEKERDVWVEGIIVASTSKANDNRITNTPSGAGDTGETAITIHKILINPKPFKPYEEGWLRRVPSRWDGRGIPEQLRSLQEWMNTVVNMRRDETLNKLTGKYKVRKGSGITRQMLQGLKAGGAIVVEEMEDIQELIERDVKPSAYQEPREIISMADRVTGSFEISRGESLPASLPATTAVLQDRGSKSTFELIQENMGLMFERMIRRHLIPMIVSELTENEVLRLTGEFEDLEIIDQSIIDVLINEERIKMRRTGASFNIYDEREVRKRAEKKYKSMGKDRLVKINKAMFDPYYDVDVDFSGDKFDPAVLARSLNDVLFNYAQIPGINLDTDGLVKEILDVLGISGSRFVRPGAAQNTQNLQPEALGQVPTSTNVNTRGRLEALGPQQR